MQIDLSRLISGGHSDVLTYPLTTQSYLQYVQSAKPSIQTK